MDAVKVELRQNFDKARESFFAACDNSDASSMRQLCRQAWDAGLAMECSARFDYAEMMLVKDDLETISAITTLNTPPSAEVKAFYDRIAKRSQLPNI